MNRHPYDFTNGFHLPSQLGSRLESFFDADLSRVQLHLSDLPKSLGCLALTAGDHIFMPEKWNPDTPERCYILAHEVTHVLQQRLSRLPCPRGHKAEVVIDPLLELEADINGLGFVWGTLDKAVLNGAGALSGEASTAGFFPQFQPVVTIKKKLKRKGKEYTAGNFEVLWARLKASKHYKKMKPRLEEGETDLMRTKLHHWVCAPKTATFTNLGHKKGRDKQFVSYSNLCRALIGRIRSREAKQLEARFAALIGPNAQVNNLLIEGVKRIYTFHKTNIRHFEDARADYKKTGDSRSNYGRYADYYSRGISKLRYLGLGSVNWARPRSYDDAFTYILESKKRVANYKIAAFLADYSMIARNFFEAHIKDAVPDIQRRQMKLVTRANQKEMEKLKARAMKKRSVKKEAETEAHERVRQFIVDDCGYKSVRRYKQLGRKQRKNVKRLLRIEYKQALEEKAAQYAQDHYHRVERTLKKRGLFVSEFKDLFKPDENDRPLHKIRMNSRSPLKSHFNVNEGSDWVKAARKKGIRLGAGASATTLVVLQMFQIIYPHNETKLAVCLALFEFWNRHLSKRYSEIHTWHEVMAMADSYCSDHRLLPGDLEYPGVEQLENWLENPARKVVLTPRQTKRIVEALEGPGLRETIEMDESATLIQDEILESMEAESDG